MVPEVDDRGDWIEHHRAEVSSHLHIGIPPVLLIQEYRGNNELQQLGQQRNGRHVVVVFALSIFAPGGQKALGTAIRFSE